MRHLRRALIELDPSGEDTPFTLGHCFGYVVGPGIEEDDLHLARLVKDVDPVGKPFGTGRYMQPHRDLDGGDFSIPDFGDFWPGPPVDKARRQVPQEIDHLRPGELFDQLFEARAYARQRARRGKKRKKDFRPHRSPDHQGES
ncbi:MAG: hypothetical protein AMXMBFR74_13140 [Parvibaculum sp.]